MNSFLDLKDVLSIILVKPKKLVKLLLYDPKFFNFLKAFIGCFGVVTICVMNPAKNTFSIVVFLTDFCGFLVNFYDLVQVLYNLKSLHFFG